MSFRLDIDADISGAQRKLFNMENGVVRQAAARAINRTMSQVNTGAVRELKDEIGQTTGLTSTGIKKSIRVVKATRRNLYGSLTPSGRALPLIGFGARQTKAGVTAKSWGKRKTYKGAFIAKMPSGHKGVFHRVAGKYAKNRKNHTKHSMAIEEMYGPSLPKEFSKQKILASMKRIARTVWPKQFERELKYRLSRLK